MKRIDLPRPSCFHQENCPVVIEAREAQLESCEEELATMFNPDYLKFKDGVKAGRLIQSNIDQKVMRELFEAINGSTHGLYAYEIKVGDTPGLGFEEDNLWYAFSNKFWQSLKARFLGEKDDR